MSMHHFNPYFSNCALLEIDAMKNIHQLNLCRTEAGGDKKPLTQKLDWSAAAKSKIGSLENKSHKAGS